MLVLDSDLPAIQTSMKEDPVAQEIYKNLKLKADKMLTEPPADYIVVDGEILRQSRNALKRITTLAGLYRLNHDKRYFQRAREEMMHVCQFKDFHPVHFLDTAELTNALAIGYDWLYADLSAEDRKTIKEAIIHKGLEAGLADYKLSGWWASVAHNWNIVCNGGLTVGALSIADEEPLLAQKVLASALVSVSIPFRTFAPDGGWPEGPMYWNYATRYAVFMIASLESALKTNFDLDKSPGFDQTGLFRIYLDGPSKYSFNFADSDAEMDRAWQLDWMSRRFKQPVYAGAELQMAKERSDIFHLLYYQSKRSTPVEAKLPLNKLFKGVDVAILRQSWTEPNSFFVGFKGGNNSANHGHLDLGTFVMDAYGVRWAEDLGSDLYSLPGYFGKQRGQYYRIRSEGHNTLTIDRSNQSRRARAKIVDFSAKPQASYAIADLSEGYGDLRSVKRGLILLSGKHQVFIQDEIESDSPKAMIWHLHTAARVTLKEQGRKAILEQKKDKRQVRLIAEIVAPAGAAFAPEPVKVPKEESQQPDVIDLSIPIQLKTTGLNCVLVKFSVEPDGKSSKSAAQASAQAIIPLASWKNAAW